MIGAKKIILSFIILLAVVIFPLFSELTYGVLEYKDGHKAAVCITFDYEDDFPHSIYVPERPADLKGDLPEKTGRVLSLLEKHDVRATFFVVGIMVQEFPESFGAIKSAGHEVASHGDYHKGYSQTGITDPSSVPYFGELELYPQMERIENAEVLLGLRPVGFRAPGLNLNDGTLMALEKLGYAYDSSVQKGNGTKPYHPEVGGESLDLLEIPVSGENAYAWDLYGRKYDGPDPTSQWIKDFESAYENGEVFVPLLHPAFIGKDSRLLETLDGLMTHIEGYSVWTTTLGELADWHKKREKLAVRIRNSRGLVSMVEIENDGGRMEGIVLRIDGKVRVLGNGVEVARGESSTVIAFNALDAGKKRLLILRI